MASIIRKEMSTKILFTLLAGLVLASATDSASKKVCDKWAQMASNMTGSGRIQNCTSSRTPSDCTRLDCSGSVHFNIPIPGSSLPSLEMDYCFGAQLLSCNDPIAMDFYLQLPQSPNHFKKAVRVTGDRTISLTDINLGGPLKATPQLVFLFEKRSDGNINFSVMAKVKMGPIFIDSLQRTLIDREVIHALPCPSGSKQSSSTEPDPNFMPENCSASAKPQSSTAAPLPEPPASLTLNKTCDSTEATCSLLEICDVSSTPPRCICNADARLSTHGTACVGQDRINLACRAAVDCGPNEHCQKGKGGKLTCQCEPGNQYDSGRRICVRPKAGSSAEHGKDKPSKPVVTPTKPPTPGKPQEPSKVKSEETSNSKVPIIVGGAVGGFVVLAAIVIANVYLFRRYRRRRQSHGSGLISESDEPLLGDDGDVNMIM